MDRVNRQASILLSRVASGDIPFNKAAERSGVNTVGLFGGSQVIDNADAAWTPEANVTAALDTGIVGSANKLTVAGAFGTGLVASKDISVLDLSPSGAINFLFKSNTDLAAGVLQVGISETIAMGGSPEWEDIPAIVADKWYYFSIAFTGAASTRNATLSVGLNAVSDPGAVILWIDEVRAGAVYNDIAGFAIDDQAKENEKAEAKEDVLLGAAGNFNVELQAGQTCVAEQRLYPVPGLGSLTATEIVMNGRPITATEDQPTAGGRIGVRL